MVKILVTGKRKYELGFCATEFGSGMISRNLVSDGSKKSEFLYLHSRYFISLFYFFPLTYDVLFAPRGTGL